MNELIAIITNIQNIDNLNILSLKLGNHNLEMLSLELDSQIKINTKVSICIKSSNITIAKDFSKNISCSNQIKSKITSIKNGKLLSAVNVFMNDVLLEIVVTLKCAKNMNLQVNDEVVLLIKETDISILKIA